MSAPAGGAAQARDIVVLDLGGVLVRWDPEAFMRETVGDTPRAHAARDAIFSSLAWRPLDLGGITERDAVEAVIAEHPALAPEIRTLFAGYKDRVLPIPRNVAALDRLRADGHPVYLLSNIFAEMFEHLSARHDLFGRFTGMILSYEEGVAKPDPEIYRRLCARYGFPPERAVFADDLPANVAAAAALGFATVRVTPDLDLYAAVREHLG